MNYKDLQNIKNLSKNILSESTQINEHFLDRWPYNAPYLNEEVSDKTPEKRQ